MTDHQPDDDFLSAARRAHGPISEDEIKQGEEMLALRRVPTLARGNVPA